MSAKQSLRLCSVVLVFIALTVANAQPHQPSTVRLANIGKISLSFTPNEGQFTSGVQYVAHGDAYSVALRAGEATVVVAPRTTSGKDEATGPSQTVQLRLEGRNPQAAAVAEEKQVAVSNYLIGPDASRWRTRVPNYGRVRYRNVYRGIDLVYYGNQGELEHDFVVAPGADPRTIRMRLVADAKVALVNGEVEIRSAAGVLRLRRPILYQQTNGVRRVVAGGYRVAGDEIGFEVGDYDRSQPLTIDPTLTLAFRFGGSNYTAANAAATDSAGNLYIAGTTEAGDYPLAKPLANTCGSGNCSNGGAFVSEISADGSTLLFSTYLAGSKFASANGIAVDGAGNIYLAGSTGSSDFPIANAFQASCPNSCQSSSGFVTKLAAAGTRIVYSTFFGGTSFEPGASALAVDSTGNAYIAGSTGSRDFPVKNAFQSTLSGFQDAYVAKFDPNGVLLYSSFLGGSTSRATAIAVDSSGNMYVAGSTSSTTFPTTPGAMQTACGGGCANNTTDAFVTKLDPTGTKLLFSTYLGGSGSDVANAIGRGPGGVVFVAGATTSTNFPTVAPLQSTCGGCADGVNSAFVTELKADGSGAVYSTYLGGSADTQALALVVDAAGEVLVGGNTAAPDFPTVQPFKAIGGGGIFKSADGTKSWKTSNSGLHSAVIRGLAVDSTGGAVYAGTSAGVYKSTDGGSTWNVAGSGIPAGSKVGAVVVDPAHTSTIYAAVDNTGVYKSTDGGNTWTAVNSGLSGGTFASLAVDPTNSSNVYVGGSAGLFKTTNGGTAWTASGTGLPTGGSVNAIVIDSTLSSTLYAGVKTSSGTGGVFKSANGGTSWTPASTGVTNLNVNALAINPANHLVLYCATDGDVGFGPTAGQHPGGLFKSSDGGTTWTTALAAPAFNNIISVAFDPANSSNLYAGTNGTQLLGSKDGGLTWNGVGLLEAQIISLAFQGGSLYAGTDGRSPYSGSNDGFVSWLNAAGNALLFSTYRGGTGGDRIQAMAITSGRLLTIGTSNSTDSPTVGSGPGATAAAASISRVSPNSAAAGSGGLTITVSATQSGTIASAQVNQERLPRPEASVRPRLGPWDVGPSFFDLTEEEWILIEALAPFLGDAQPVVTPDLQRPLSLAPTATFVSGATVLWNGSPRPTTYVDANTLTAQISAADLATAGTAQVSVQNPGAAASNSVPFYISNAVVPQPGWWWDPSLNGTGFFVEFGGKSNNGMFLAGFLYDAAGNATWLVSTGQMSGATYNSNWLKVSGGQTLTGSYKAPTSQTPVGNISITFTDSTHGVMTRPDGTKINIQRFSFSATATPAPPVGGASQNGWWWAGSSLSGTGIGVEIQGSAIFAVAYYYDSAGNPVWYLATGALASPTSFVGTWDVYAGGPQLTSPEGSYSAHKVSSATPLTLTFTSATTGVMTMGNTVVPITRFQEF